MNLQQMILYRYKEIYGEQTFSKLSKSTGINVSRLFRLFNGAKMRVDEYELFQKKIHEKEVPLSGVLERLSLIMNDNEKNELKTHLERKLKKWEIGV